MATRDIDSNDNEQLPFQPLSIAAESIVKRLQNDKSEQRDGDQPSTREKEQERAENHRRYLEQRLKETAIWERRIDGK